jgi:hypothetical protein
MRYHAAEMHDAERAALLAVIEAQNATIQALHGWIQELTRNGQATTGGRPLPSPSLAAPSATALLAPPAGDGDAPPAAAASPPSGARTPGWVVLVLLVLAAGSVGVIASLMRTPGDPLPDLTRVPDADQGIGYSRALLPGVYPLVEQSTGRTIVLRGSPVYVDEEGQRVALPERGRVPIEDQGIDVAHPRAPGVYLLLELSSGRPILDNGSLVYVDEEGRPVPPGQVAQQQASRSQ